MNLRVFGFVLVPFIFTDQLNAHPHVFVDGGVDFVIEEGPVLKALEVTWLFDKFETLYLLSASGVTLSSEGKLPQDAWRLLESEIGSWPDSFSGSAHVSIAGHAVPLADPTGFNVRMVDARLELTFTRALSDPLDIANMTLDTEFYEASYFYDFSVTQSPRILGDQNVCTTEIIPFVADKETQGFQDALAALGREQTPDQPNIGSLFADRIVLTCA